MGRAEIYSKWRICSPIDVTLAAVLIGLGYLFMCVIMLTEFIVIWLKQKKVIVVEDSLLDFDVFNSLFDETDETNFFSSAYHSAIEDFESYFEAHTVQTVLMIFLSILTLSLVVIMIYGAVKKVAWCLLPFLIWQVLDLVLTTCFYIALYFWYKQSISSGGIVMNPQSFSGQLLDLTYNQFFICWAIIFFCMVLWKMYALLTVYRCFQSLTESTKSGGIAGEVNGPSRLTAGGVEFLRYDHNLLNDSESTIFFNEKFQ